jgi:hypothetical protein
MITDTPFRRNVTEHPALLVVRTPHLRTLHHRLLTPLLATNQNCDPFVAVVTSGNPTPPGSRRRSPASGYHGTLHADFWHYARQK